MNHRSNYLSLSRIALWGIVLAVLAVPAILIWEIQASFHDYDKVKACLADRRFKVLSGWQYEDIGLEAFGWTFQTATGRQLEIRVYKGDRARDCDDPVDGVEFSNDMAKTSRYLSFAHPELVAALGGKRIRTMDELLARLEIVLDWAAANNAALTPKATTKNPHAYLHIRLKPAQQRQTQHSRPSSLTN